MYEKQNIKIMKKIHAAAELAPAGLHNCPRSSHCPETSGNLQTSTWFPSVAGRAARDEPRIIHHNPPPQSQQQHPITSHITIITVVAKSSHTIHITAVISTPPLTKADGPEFQMPARPKLPELALNWPEWPPTIAHHCSPVIKLP